ncbi:YdcF family protein [Rhizobiaceae bacterium BDR2-2]|uniref:YdcF family protein n=1 Tax=Ectorhizobium quercum TaxID=2965071 RepID=A0AAE3STE4_9HYPH|nr:YdcF family protein [Ectorhizobium quercum]MCX8995603.1 YdcF family protein [Ectorhizobium quercum]
MFHLSKIFWLLAQPLSLAFLLIAAGLLAIAIGWRRAGMGFHGVAVLLLFVTLYTSTGSYLLHILEERFPRPLAEPHDLSCMIVLGGGFDLDVTTARGTVELNQAGDRLVEALRLALKHPQARIVISGGDGSLSGPKEGDAAAAERFYPAFGIGADRLVLEGTSRTTFENVTHSKAILDEAGLRDCLLITSAFHMPRSIGLFRRQGIEVVAWPTDYRTGGGIGRPSIDFTQPSLNTQLMSTAIREWIGLAAYRLAGRTDAFFPG